MKKYNILYLALMLLTAVCGLTACSEDDNTVDEFADWQQKNDTYFESVYAQAKANADGKWLILPSWTVNDSIAALSPTSNVVAHVITEGTGSSCPIYTDPVQVHYRGRVIPSTSYPEGWVFDQSFTGNYNTALMTPSKFAVSGTNVGFATALQYMKIGDRWEVYIPYDLGYGESDYQASSSSTTIPGGSTLIFDVTLVGYHHPGETVTTKAAGAAKASGYWVTK